MFSIAAEMEKFVPFALLSNYRLLASPVLPYLSDIQIATAFLCSPSVVCLTVQYFSTLSHKDKNFFFGRGGEVFESKM